MTRICAVFAAVAIAAVPIAFAQHSSFQDANGRTSLYIDEGANVTFNFSDSKFTAGAFSNWGDQHKHVFLGYEVFAKLSNGASTLFTHNGSVPEGGGDLSIGAQSAREAPTSDCYHWVLLDLGYSRGTLYAAPAPVPLASAKHSFDRFRALAVYNRLENEHFVFAAAAGVERRNNRDDLTPATFQLHPPGGPGCLRRRGGQKQGWLPRQLPPVPGSAGVFGYSLASVDAVSPARVEGQSDRD